MKYRDQPFNQRIGTLGDMAEEKFETIAPLGKWERLGWNRPTISMRHMTPFLRHMPDYACSTGHTVEVGGLGKDGVWKLKVDKYAALKEWNRVAGPLAFFVWNSSKQEWALIEWGEAKSLVSKARNRGIEAFENDGNEYYPVLWDDVEHTVPYGA